VVLGDGVESIEHFDQDEDGQTQGAGLYLSLHEVLARLFGKVEAVHEVVNLEAFPGRAVSPVHELVHGNEGVTISGTNIEDVPVDEDSNAGNTNVESYNAVAEVSPVGNETVIGSSWGLFHDVIFSGVEAEGSGRRAVSHQVHPEELHGVEAFGDAEHSSEEDSEDLTDVTGDKVSNEGLHVAVNRATFFHSFHNGGEVVVVKDHVRSTLGDFGSCDSHGNTNGGLLDGGGVVDTVTSHGYDFIQVVD